MLGAFLKANGIAAEIVTLSGAVEIAPRIGKFIAAIDAQSDKGANNVVRLTTTA